MGGLVSMCVGCAAAGIKLALAGVRDGPADSWSVGERKGPASSAQWPGLGWAGLSWAFWCLAFRRGKAHGVSWMGWSGN
jgi:hypothetical protein